MTELPTGSRFSEASPSVQVHLEIIQGVIERMATNSTSSKAWCVTLVSAILVLVADKGKPEYALIAFVPTLLFAALDAYYLALEKGFRNSYKDFVSKVHDGAVVPDDLFEVAPIGDSSALQVEALRSFSVWGFYTTLALMVVIAWQLVLQ